jgi:SAM-dependent methyltransferase
MVEEAAVCWAVCWACSVSDARSGSERLTGRDLEGRHPAMDGSELACAGEWGAAGRRRLIGHPQRGRLPAVSRQRMFMTTVPGLSRLAGRELIRLAGVTVVETGRDGRNDLVLVEVDPGRAAVVRDFDLAEDVFVELGRTLRSEGDQAHWMAGRVWRGRRVEEALQAWAALSGAAAGPVTFRVVARVLQERSFRRTELRHQLTRAIQQDRPAWRQADPARLEVWLSEYRSGRLVAGLRVTGRRNRQRQGRQVERPGALRPTVAAAMVRLAGTPGGLLLDPCCGTGTILAEASAWGWEARGFDVENAAVRAAGRNVPGAAVELGDARRIDLPDQVAGACVSNLPFGQRFTVPEGMRSWLNDVMSELARVTRPGGRVVVLAPEIPAEVRPSRLRALERYRVDLLGTPATIWAYERRRDGQNAGG